MGCFMGGKHVHIKDSAIIKREAIDMPECLFMKGRVGVVASMIRRTVRILVEHKDVRLQAGITHD